MTKKDPMNEARKRVIMDHSWWGALSLRLRIEEDNSIPTACVDGKTLRYNRVWFESLNRQEQETVLAHETEHCALGHPWRLGKRELKLANIAMDHVVNLDLKQAGFRLPEPNCSDPRFAGMAYEKVYSILECERLQKQPQKCQGKTADSSSGETTACNSGQATEPNKSENQGSNGNSKQSKGLSKPSQNNTETEIGETSANDGEDAATTNVTRKTEDSNDSSPENWGQVAPAPEPKPNQDGSEDDLAREWEKAVEVATLVAQKAGELPVSLKRAIQESKTKTEDLVGVLQEYITVKGGYSFSSPNKRMIHSGVYLPGRVKSYIENIVFAVDTSGSISQSLLDFFASKCNEVLSMEAAPEKITVVYCDAAIQRTEEFTEGRLEFHPYGGGGTAFQPVFDWVNENLDNVQVLVYLTDLYGSDNARLREPEYPVLWLAPHTSNQEMLFGQVMLVDPYQV